MGSIGDIKGHLGKIKYPGTMVLNIISGKEVESRIILQNSLCRLKYIICPPTQVSFMKPFKIYENFRKMTRKNASNIYEVTNIIHVLQPVLTHMS